MILPRFSKNNEHFIKLEARNPSSYRSPFYSGKVSEYSCY